MPEILAKRCKQVYLNARKTGLAEGFVKNDSDAGRKVEAPHILVGHWDREASFSIRSQDVPG